MLQQGWILSEMNQPLEDKCCVNSLHDVFRTVENKRQNGEWWLPKAGRLEAPFGASQCQFYKLRSYGAGLCWRLYNTARVSDTTTLYVTAVRPGVVAHNFSPCTQESETGRSLWVPGRPGGHSITLSQGKKKKREVKSMLQCKEMTSWHGVHSCTATALVWSVG